MKGRNWFWGIFFIIAAILVIINQLGYFTQISLFTLVCTIFLIPILIKSCIHLNFGGILFPIALLAIIFAEPLGITALSPWTLLAAALLGTIGLSLIFHKHEHYHTFYQGKGACSKMEESEDGSNVDIRVSFNGSTKYINTKDFQKGTFECSFGELKVFFDQASLNPNGAELLLNVSFGGVELYLPKTWKVVNRLVTSFGGVEEKNCRVESDSPTLVIDGKCSFSGVSIIYI